MNVPLPIQTYFDAGRRSDSKTLALAFAPDAVVKDEGRSHVGRPAIDAWWRDARTKYQHLVEPLEATEMDDATSVSARVTGQFPGSPAMLTFTFRLKGGRITDLEIGG